MKKILISGLTILALLGGGFLLAQSDTHLPGPKTGTGQGHYAPFNKDYMRSMNNMHGPMMEGLKSTDPDVAFVRGMIAHHQGAVEMSEIQLKYGKDPELKKLAQEIIKAQDREIKLMEEWLKKYEAPK